MSDNLIWEDRKHFMWFPWSFTKYYIENETTDDRSWTSENYPG